MNVLITKSSTWEVFSHQHYFSPKPAANWNNPFSPWIIFRKIIFNSIVANLIGIPNGISQGNVSHGKRVTTWKCLLLMIIKKIWFLKLQNNINSKNNKTVLYSNNFTCSHVKLLKSHMQSITFYRKRERINVFKKRINVFKIGNLNRLLFTILWWKIALQCPNYWISLKLKD